MAALLLAGPGGSLAQPAESGADDASIAVLVQVNGQDKGDFILRREGDDWLIPTPELARLGLPADGWTLREIDGAPHASLRSRNGLQWRLEERSLTLQLTADPSLLGTTVIGTGRVAPAPRMASRSAYLNWAAEQDSSLNGAGTTLRLSSEAGWRDGPLLLVTQAQSMPRPEGSRALVRLGTTGTWDRPQQGQVWTVGDVFSRGGALAQSLHLGGFAVARGDFDPSQLRYPLGSLHGQAMLPSEVEVYVNGQRIRSERVSPGEFELRDVYTPPGAGAVRLVVRDPYGREQRYDYSIYTTDQLLRPGLHEYQYAAGWLRRDYGQRSFDYGDAALAATHRWGWTEHVTLGMQAAARTQWINGGPSVTARLGALGLLGYEFGGSQAGARKSRSSAWRYEYQGPGWGIGILRREHGAGYAAVAQERTVTNLRREGYLYASVPLGSWAHAWLSHASTRVRALAEMPASLGFTAVGRHERTAGTLGVSHVLPGVAGTLRTSVSRIDDARGRRNEFALSLTLALASRSLLVASHHSGPAGSTQAVQWARAAPLGEGWGFDVSGYRERERERERDGGNAAPGWRGAAQWNAPGARLRAEYERAPWAGQRADRMRLAASGGLAWLDGRVHVGRPIEGAFALVKVGELQGVPVRVNGSVAGTTDGQGLLFLSDVSSGWETDFSIDSRQLPIDWNVSRPLRRLVVPDRMGAVIDFEAVRVRTLLARLLRGDGAAAMARMTVRLRKGERDGEGEIDTATGMQGELYLENLPPGRYDGVVDDGRTRCRFVLDVPADDQVMVDAGDLPCRP